MLCNVVLGCSVMAIFRTLLGSAVSISVIVRSKLQRPRDCGTATILRQADFAAALLSPRPPTHHIWNPS